METSSHLWNGLRRAFCCLTFVALMLTTLALPAPALGSEEDKMTRDDYAAILFSNRFSFTKSGEPVLSVAIMDGQKLVRFTAPTPLQVSPSGPGGPSIKFPSGGTYEVRLLTGNSAELAYRVRLAAYPTKEFQAIKEGAATWKARGVETLTVEMGTVFSFEGVVFDTRRTLLCTAATWPSAAEADKHAEEMGHRFGEELHTEEELVRRPQGELVLVHKPSGTEVRVRNALWFEPEGKELSVQDVEFGRGFAWHGKENRRYAGSFYVAVDRTGQLALVNVLAAERLLRGLVPAEIYADSPAEALKAQAITARSELFAKLGHRHLADPYHLCSEQHCQVYKGLDAELPQTNKAVEETRGQVVFTPRGTLADTRYHSTCGGHTEHGKLVWPGIESEELVGHAEKGPDHGAMTEAEVRTFIESPPPSFCGQSPRAKATFRWTETLGAGQVDKAAKGLGLVEVVALEVTQRGVSGRAMKLRLHDRQGKSAELEGELVIRRFFGGLKSSLFVVDLVPDKSGRPASWRFKGGGFGHGAGMCQNGAAEMARAGKSCDAILKHYYQGVSIARIYR